MSVPIVTSFTKEMNCLCHLVGFCCLFFANVCRAGILIFILCSITDHTQPSSDQTILRDTSIGSKSVIIAIVVIIPLCITVMAVAVLITVRVMCRKK